MLVNTFALTTAALAGLASGFPSPAEPASFHVHFTVDGKPNTYQVATIAEDKKAGTHLIVGQPLSIEGSAAHFLGEGSHRALIFDVPSSSSSSSSNAKTVQYGAIVPDIGDSYGVDVPIAAAASKTQYQWGLDAKTNQLYHKLYAAPNLFLSCKKTLNGVANVNVLSFGEAAEDGKLPKGCEVTKLVKVADGKSS